MKSRKLFTNCTIVLDRDENYYTQTSETFTEHGKPLGFVTITSHAQHKESETIETTVSKDNTTGDSPNNVICEIVKNDKVVKS